jgi:hypothetical protein
MQDHLNPNFMFQSIDSSLLLKVVTGELNLSELVAMELANRGLDDTGNWVGHAKATQL